MLRALLISVWLALPCPAALAANLTLRGDYTWAEKDADFGGLSGLIMGRNGASLTAVSDDGVVFQAAVARDGAGAVTAINVTSSLRLHDNRNRPVAGFHANAEALAPGPRNRIFVAFEGYARIAAFDLPDPKPKPLHAWNLFKPIWGNAGFESLAWLPDGRLIALVETPVDGHYPVHVQSGRSFVEVPGLPADGEWSATDAALGPDGRLYLLERRQDWLMRFQTRIRRFAVLRGKEPAFGAGETLIETRPGDLDNMEGLSLWHDTGRNVTVLSLVSDDNFMPFQSTRLVEYDLHE